MKTILVAIIVALAIGLVGCGGTSTSGNSNSSGNSYNFGVKVKSPPSPGGPWGAGAQGTFMGACDTQMSDGYCGCALVELMGQYPNQNDSAVSDYLNDGMTAAQHPKLFKDCTTKSGQVNTLPVA